MSCVPARALFKTAPRCVDIRDLPTPRPAAGEVLVRTMCSGISGGTERLVYRGEVPAEFALDDTIDALGGTFSYPFAYGYACVGEVAESGQAVFAFHPHQDIFAVRASELIPLPGIDSAAATLFPLVEPAAPAHPQHAGLHGAGRVVRDLDPAPAPPGNRCAHHRTTVGAAVH